MTTFGMSNPNTFIDDTSRQVTAVKLLVAGMKCTDKKDDPICYLYQEYEVYICLHDFLYAEH